MTLAGVGLAAACGVVLLASTARADPGPGTLADPVLVDALPWAIEGSTAGAPSDEIDGYGCAAQDESGPEVVYAFSLEAPAKVTAWIEGDGGGVDVDVHLLDRADGESCVARGNVIAEAQMSAGTHYVVVDTFGGDAQAGDFVLRLDAIGDVWTERTLAEGVIWRARRFADLAGGPQVVHELVVDPLAPDVKIEALPSNGCQTVGEIGAATGALAGINGGYFNVNTCAPVSLLVHDGQTVATQGTKRGAFGITAAGAPLIEIIAAGADWPAVEEAHGGGPVLVVGGAAYAGPSDWADQGFSNAGFNGDNPRTWAAYDTDGRVLLGTVDGRRPSADGMSLDELAAFTASAEIGATDAVNLDGGGSTSMWIANATPNGVVNYPSDDPDQETAAHGGSRNVSGGFFVFAPPFDHAPRFQTQPVTSAKAGEPYLYDADAIDLNVDDVVTFELAEAPEGMAVDPNDGHVTWQPTTESPPSVEIVLVAGDGDKTTQQAFTLSVEGGMGPPGSGATGGGGTGGGADGGAGAGGAAAAPASEDGGCSCRTAHRDRPAPVLLVLSLGVLAAAGARRGWLASRCRRMMPSCRNAPSKRS